MSHSKIVLIGASTGGPGHLTKLLKGISKNNAPIIIAQHMNEVFVPYFVSQFKREMSIDVVEVGDKEYLKNAIFICDKTSVLSVKEPFFIKPQETQSIYNPDINILFQSAVNLCEYADILAILLTGIGEDGAKGLFELYRHGAVCIAESEESAIVYGMPKRAREINPNVNVLPLDKIRERLERFLNVF
ncbi:CheB methylesterase domain-containing protein [Helicobacter sp. 13S00477-4]|uniref:CheB methylesterase domain-containing protein n=1 Tax=Helicobacter sp. 13S00477-4 TaxID=1905759 RepID=UPI000BA7B138|nr:CheB methylesterase domain-containing protein [Helicobacter sp. 13S00477-4]PAF52422.1 chemotaxis protein CheB [Helicobacter sp. 13S00477-4]